MHSTRGVNPWAALVGRRGDGRVRVARAAAQALAERGIAVGGFVHLRVDVAGEQAGQDLLDLRTGARTPLSRIAKSDPDLCDYAFDRDAFGVASAALAGGAEVLFAEAGRLEGNGHGHWPAIEAALAGPPVLLVLCLRPESAAPVALQLDDPVAGLELPADEHAIAAFVADLEQARPARSLGGVGAA